MSMKVPVFCSLLPVEMFISKGFTPHYLTPEELGCENTGTHYCHFHENICSYAKLLFEYLSKREAEFDVIVVPASCDAMKKLYSSLLEKVPKKKLFFLDHPRAKTPDAAAFYASQLAALEKFLGPVATIVACHPEPQAKDLMTSSTKIGILGSNIYSGVLIDVLKAHNAEPVYLNQCLSKLRPDDKILGMYGQVAEPLKIAQVLLEKNICPRTHDEAGRQKIINDIKAQGIKGVVVNSLKFCDFYPFEYIFLKESLGPDFPILITENDLMSKDEGQISTRLSAFLERIGGAAFTSKKAKIKGQKAEACFVGLDSGSHSTKGVCIDGSGEILAYEIIPTGTKVRDAAMKCLENLLKKAGKTRKDVNKITSTGYGRQCIEFADGSVTEITCHAVGANHVLKEPATIIDIGGQDSKAISFDGQGNVKKFVMNDKCAAGTGRFLEVMANKLHMDIGEFSKLAMETDKHVSVTSMCSVFAESEVISLLADGHGKERIAKGIHKSIAGRTASLVKRIEGEPPYYMTGGVARNKALLEELSEALGSKIKPLDNPQIMGALGAAIYSLRGEA